MAEVRDRNIKVKLRRAGWEIEISCEENQLKQAIDSVLASLSNSDQAIGQDRSETSQNSGNKTCRGLIVDLWRESWFAQPRSLGQVHEEIGRRGYHYDRTAVSHALRDLVLENILTREGNSRNYLYIQKRPPSSGNPSREGEKGLSPTPEIQESETDKRA